MLFFIVFLKKYLEIQKVDKISNKNSLKTFLNRTIMGGRRTPKYGSFYCARAPWFFSPLSTSASIFLATPHPPPLPLEISLSFKWNLLY